MKTKSNKIFRIFLLGIILSVSFFYACHPAKHVPEGDFLLKKVDIKTDAKELNSEDLWRTVRQKPNRKTLSVFRFHLFVYNITNSGKERKLKSKVRDVVGEPPIIYDSYAKDHTEKTMSSFLETQGYYQSEIDSEVKFGKRTASVTYNIKTNEPHLISEINYNISDLSILNIIDNDLSNTLLKQGEKLNTEILQDERERLVRLMKTKGYYNFSINNIHYYVDTTKQNNKAHLTLAIRKSFSEERINALETFSKQIIKDVYIYTNYNPEAALADFETYSSGFDTLIIDGIHIISHESHLIKPNIYLQSCFVIPGELYNIRNVERTHSHFNNLRQFRLINIRMEIPETSLIYNQEEYLNCHIYLSPLVKQSYSLELEGMNTSGNIGASGSITYNNRNLFKGAEILSVRGTISLQSIRSQAEDAGRFLNTFESGGELRLNIPKLMLPFFESYEFSKNHNPKTQLSTSFSYQQRPDYTRGIGAATFGYIWKGGRNSNFTHFFNPLELNLVKIYEFNPLFKAEIDSLYIRYSYEDQLLTVISYDILFNNQKIHRRDNFTYLWLNVETSGNLLNRIYKWTDQIPDGDSYKIMGVEFAQFMKADIDLRYYHILSDKQSLVYRGFLGAGIPYGNSTTGLPFIKKYFSGGANDLRAWQVRSLGPGSYDGGAGFNQIGDMKLVLNLEYRFDIISFMEGALFLDAGNIWALDKNDDRFGALFELDRFYKEIALGTGIGTRFDFSFFIIRFDFGIPLYDPKYPESDRWLRTFKDLKFRDLTLNFGIGYPF